MIHYISPIFDNATKGLCIMCETPAVPGGLTCSEICHKEFVRFCEDKFGKVKKVIDQTTGIAYEVPTRDIIELGLKWQDLRKYPMFRSA